MQHEHIFDQLAMKAGAPILNVRVGLVEDTPAFATKYDASDTAAWMAVEDAEIRFGKAEDRCSNVDTAAARADVRLAF